MAYKSYTYNGVSCQATARSSSDTQKKYERMVRYKGEERKVTYGDKEMPMRRNNDEARESFLARHNCSDKTDPFSAGFWACLDWQRPSEKSADYTDDLYEGYIVSFDGVDLTMERFTKDTNFWLDYIQPKLITFNHLQNDNLFDKQELSVIGEIDGLDMDERGIKAYFHLFKTLPKNLTDKLADFDNMVRDEHNKWLAMVGKYIEEGVLGFSSDAMPSLVRRSEQKDSGITDIESWAMPFVSLTHKQAEPRNFVLATKNVANIEVSDMQEEQEKPSEVVEGDTSSEKMMEQPKESDEMESLKAMIEELKGMLMDRNKKETDQEIERNSESVYETSIGTQKDVVIEPADVPVTLSEKSVPKIESEKPVEKGRKNVATLLKYSDKSDFLLGIRAMATGDKETIKAIGLTQSDSGVGFLMPEEYSTQIIDLLQPKSIFLNGGFASSLANFYPMSTDSMVIPTVLSGTSGSWIDEGQTLPESNMKFGSIRLNAKKYGFHIALNNDSLRDANIALETKVREQMVKDLSIAIDRAILDGLGGAQPLGVGRTSGVTITSKGGTIGYTDLLSVIDRVEASNVELDDSAAWIFPSSIKTLLRKMVSPANDYIWTDTQNITQIALGSAPTPLLGHKWYANNTVSLGMAGGDSDKYTLFFGKWSDLIIGMRMNIELNSTDQGTFWMKDQTAIRAIIRMDVAVSRPESFEIIKNITLS